MAYSALKKGKNLSPSLSLLLILWACSRSLGWASTYQAVGSPGWGTPAMGMVREHTPCSSFSAYTWRGGDGKPRVDLRPRLKFGEIYLNL